MKVGCFGLYTGSKMPEVAIFNAVNVATRIGIMKAESLVHKLSILSLNLLVSLWPQLVKYFVPRREHQILLKKET